MNKTKIEWCDYTINPVKGKCPMGCSYCYARRMYDRFKWNPEIRYEDPFWQFYKLKGKPPCRVFVGSTIELFGEWIAPEWWHNIFSYCRAYPEHSFLFLTKLPQNLPMVIAQIGGKLPENCWVGVTITSNSQSNSYIGDLANVQALVKFISIEPLLAWSDLPAQRELLPRKLKDYGINWLIIGQQTPVSKKTEPKLEWVQEIVEAADKVGIPVFLKDNLETIIPQERLFRRFPGGLLGNLRQEFPEQ